MKGSCYNMVKEPLNGGFTNNAGSRNLTSWWIVGNQIQGCVQTMGRESR